ncbi:MAG TPA: Rrf2 family transcriptional regulator [Candidatus Tectomicrobia bacterium]
MKLSSQEEYGLRCLLQVARRGPEGSMAIPEIAGIEGLSIPHVAKLMRLLRRGGFVKSVRGQAGGYKLARTPDQINIGEVLAWMGGRLFEPSFCTMHSGMAELCTHSVDCSIRSLWQSVQHVVDQVLGKVTLADLLGGERQVSSWITDQTEVLHLVSGPS